MWLLSHLSAHEPPDRLLSVCCESRYGPGQRSSDLVADLVRDCWAAQPKLRPSFEAICERLEAVRVAGEEERPVLDEGCACTLQ